MSTKGSFLAGGEDLELNVYGCTCVRAKREKLFLDFAWIEIFA